MKSIYADKYQQIGLKIAYYRKLRGLTQEQLGGTAGAEPRLHRPRGGPQHQQGRVLGHAV